MVLIHQGGVVPTTQSVSTINLCDGNLVDSPIKAIVNQLDDEVDLVVSGHTHQAYIESEVDKATSKSCSLWDMAV